jgi:HAE1 family hydrophobic/amphiphilic exporter-1
MASAVATPLERQFTGISGLDSMVSVSSTGNTQITLQFDLNRQLDSAVDVQTRLPRQCLWPSACRALRPSAINPSDFGDVSRPHDQHAADVAATSTRKPALRNACQ